jgi:hypothetical protein
VQGVVDERAGAGDVATCGAGTGEALADLLTTAGVRGGLGVEGDLVHGDGLAAILVDKWQCGGESGALTV